MVTLLSNLGAFFVGTAPYWGLFLGTLALTLVLVPLVREMNRFFGMVDKPGPRRINKTPIPRGGGLAIYLAFAATTFAWDLFASRPLVPGITPEEANWLRLSAFALVALGYADDKFGLPPLVKLAGQIAVSLTATLGCDIGFAKVFPGIPHALDVALTVFWLTGAMNAFNLIDGLDGLSAGLASIATLGMAGALFCLGQHRLTFVHLAFLGALVGFLRYNFHPASVFMGDSGSMFVGFVVATLPLLTRASNSFFVSVGIPLLAMGVPIFDTALAILRRTLRAALSRREEGPRAGGGKVMTADADHLHHRVLRALVSQRKAALALYAFAAFFVFIGLGGLLFEDRGAALFIVGFLVVATVMFRDMRRIELWDAGRLLNAVVHDRSTVHRRRLHLLRGPLLVAGDLLAIVVAFLLTALFLRLPLGARAFNTWLILRGVPLFVALVFFRAYATVWSRAMLSNYVRLFLAVIVGGAASAVLVVVARLPHNDYLPFTLCFSAVVFIFLSALRLLRAAARDFFYALDAGRLAETPGIKRVVVYGAGLRYRTFRRELVRAASRSDRVIVGLLDDDLLLRDQYVGGIRIYGTLEQAPDVLRRMRADAVVIACELTPERLAVARRMFAACGVPATLFALEERAL